MGYPNIVFTKADVATHFKFCLMCCLLSQGHDSLMCLWLIFLRPVLHSKIGGTYIFRVSCFPPQYTAESCSLNSAVCASEIGVERMWQRVCSSTHLLQHCMFSTTRLFQEKWEKVSNIHMWNANREQEDEEMSHLLLQKHEIKLQF